MPKSAQEKAEIRRQTEARRRPDKDRTAHESAYGQKRRSLSDLSKAELTDDEFMEAVEMIRKESDRGVAIMGAALVEDGLVELLETALKNRDCDAALFSDAGAPFGTFRAKAISTYALGLCDKKTFDHIETSGKFGTSLDMRCAQLILKCQSLLKPL